MRTRLIDWYFPLLVAALVLCGTNLAPAILNGTTRWLLVLSGAAIAVTSVAGRRVWRSGAFMWMAAYLLLCLASAAWSEMPTLSLYKALAACLVMAGMFSCGYVWMQRRAQLSDLWKLFYWLVIASLLVAVLGRSGEGLSAAGGGYYAGLTGNSNYLGWMMSVSVAPLLWRVLDRHASTRQKFIYVVLLVMAAYYLLQSQSRGSMLVVLCSCFGLLVVSGASKKLLALGGGTLLLLVTLLAAPGFGGELYAKYVLKDTGLSMSAAFEKSRGAPTEESFAGAKQGGFLGAGYGVSVGADPSGYRGGLSAVGYGREKGNSALAIIEEIGLIGLVLVLLLLLHIFGMALKAYRMSYGREVRALIGLSTGLWFGLVVHFNFEAWLVAPGSAESLFFWGYIGALYAMYRRVIYEARARQRQSLLVGGAIFE